MAHQLLGANPTRADTSAEFALGTTYCDHKGREFVYVEVDDSGGVAAGDMCIIYGNFTVKRGTATLAAHDAGAGLPCGLALVALADNEFGWLAIKGTGSDFLLKCVGACDDYQPLLFSATEGEVDNQDAGSATAPRIEGAVITTAASGAETEICVLNYPVLLTDYPA